MEPHVPGPGLPNPAPKKVATVQAQKVLLPAMNWQVGPSGQPPLAAMARALAMASSLSALAGFFFMFVAAGSPGFVAFRVVARIGSQERADDLSTGPGPALPARAAA